GRRRYKDGRTWKHRIEQLNAAWGPLIEGLTDAYVGWKYGLNPPTAASESFSFNISIIDVHSLESEARIERNEETTASVALVQAGYLGTAPEQPSLAVSLRTLELYYTLRLFKPSFSIEAFAKVLCHLYSVPYRRTYRTALSDTFDIYLTIQRKVNRQVAQKLGQDSPNYRVLNSCPPCCYEAKPELQFTRMFVVDGNNSLKRMAGIGKREVADTRVFNDSDYYLSEDFVDLFANEVKARPSVARADDSDDNAEELEEDWVDTVNGDPTDGAPAEDPELVQCAENWKAAASDLQKKKMWGIFRETGIFASACRHSLVLWVCDMVRSGELAKYPLAIVAKALEVFGPQWLLGYDIGCTFSGTINNSSLGPEFRRQKCRTCVNAFHGYSHNALCQQCFHPLNITGMGLEDLETLERLFSSSNQLASLTRYMSPYRRRIFIDMFFQQWDRDKYQNLATLLHNNYLQALKIIEEEGAQLESDLALKGLTVEDLEAYFLDESSHLKDLGKETEEDLHAVTYVEHLLRYRELSAACENASDNFRSTIPEQYQYLSAEKSYSENFSETRRAETKRKFLVEARDKALFEVVKMEETMGVGRWNVTDREYIETLQYINDRKYRKALEHLSKLIVQRLFELHKMNLSFTGYKMRTHIASALQRRSKAIRNAVKRYNAAAVGVGRPTLDWAKVTHYTFLDQFNILQDTRHSVLDKKWADPVIRHLMKQHRRVQRAKEELLRCNIEIRRLQTFILDEHSRFDAVLGCIQNTAVWHPVNDYIQRRRAINQLLLSRIHETHALPGFTGDRTPGIRRGS
ncbi:hypothetical protein BT96DRAFT_751532, partial [Gymnopus androsaceus JB14]